jgi:HAD superfamily hydrolase (TIGR01484 family)
MYISCLATDYDGTLAGDGIVDDATADALVAFRRSGRRLLLVTGRELPDLVRVLPRIDLFDRVVAENGASLYGPATKKETPLGPEPSPELAETLREKGVNPLSVGRSIVATWEPNEKLVLDAIREHGLEPQIVFNKGAVMVLPPGINKASGLKAALEDLGLSAHKPCRSATPRTTMPSCRQADTPLRSPMLCPRSRMKPISSPKPRGAQASRN